MAQPSGSVFVGRFGFAQRLGVNRSAVQGGNAPFFSVAPNKGHRAVTYRNRKDLAR